MSMFNNIEYWTENNEQTCLANAAEVTEYAKAFELGHWCFCGLGLAQSMVSFVGEQTKRSMGPC